MASGAAKNRMLSKNAFFTQEWRPVSH